MTENVSDTNSWISLSDAAEQTGYSVSTLQRLVRLRKLPAKKSSKKWFVQHTALIQYIESAAPGRKPAEPARLPPQGLTLWFPKMFSKSPLGLDAIVNGVQYHFAYLRLEYPQGSDDHLAELAPGIPGFYSFSARASVPAIRWLERQFASGDMHIEILKRDFPIVHYSGSVDSVLETIGEGTNGYISAAFGFYRAEVKPSPAIPAPLHPSTTHPHAYNPAQRQMPAGEWLHMEDASQQAGLSIAELRTLSQQGKITAMKRYGHWQVNSNSLQSFLQEHLLRPNAAGDSASTLSAPSVLVRNSSGVEAK